MLERKSLPLISEYSLRQIWKRQVFQSHNLLTLDWKEIKIITPGVSNPNGGPDFLDARIKIGEITFAGDVELHCHFSDWRQHSHHTDPKYNRVILHVVLFADKNQVNSRTKSKRDIPTLVLESYLTEDTFRVIETSAMDEKAGNYRQLWCGAQSSSIGAEIIQGWLKKLSVERIECMVRRFEERLKTLVQTQKIGVTEPAAMYGKIPFEVKPEEMPDFSERYSPLDFTDVHLWEQLLYEFIMEGFGYSKNQSPFLRLARNVDLKYFRHLDNIKSEENKNLIYEAVLFGVAGLLPSSSSIKTKEGKTRVLKLKKIWKAYKDIYKGELLNNTEWQFFRLRPENFPTRRIAGAATLVEQIVSDNVFKSIIQVIQTDSINNTEKVKLFFPFLTIKADGFWENHFTFADSASKPMKLLVGKERAIELIINVIIPISLLYARIFKKTNVRKNALSLFENIKSSKSNAVLKIIDEQLVKSRFKLDTASLYQGAVQLFKFYCAERKCADCEIGKLVFYE
jgi:hypothetical protein